MTAESTIQQDEEQDRSPEESEEDTRDREAYFVSPAVDIFEREDGLVLMADLPGVQPSDLTVKLEHGILTIQARARHLMKGDPIYREFRFTGFYRQFRLSDEVDSDAVEGELKNGVLTLRLKRAAKAMPKRIEVRAA